MSINNCMKYDGLIVCGDSYSNGYNSIRNMQNGERWPELLAEKINLPVENLSRGGASNTEIAYQLFNKLETPYNYPLIIFAFTHSLRVPFFGNDGKLFSLYGIDNDSMAHQETVQRTHRLNLGRKYFQSFVLDVQHNNKTLSGLEFLTLESLNTIKKYKNFFPKCEILWGQIHSNDFTTLFTKNIQQYFAVDQNCFNIDNQMLPLETILQENHRISNNDNHPNIKGMEVLADYFFTFLDKYYL